MMEYQSSQIASQAKQISEIERRVMGHYNGVAMQARRELAELLLAESEDVE
jgi:hypothetical protein